MEKEIKDLDLEYGKSTIVEEEDMHKSNDNNILSD